jgi:hypothetical protein
VLEYSTLWLSKFSLIHFRGTVLETTDFWGGDGLAVNMSGQHVCVLGVRVLLLPSGGYSGV